MASDSIIHWWCWPTSWTALTLIAGNNDWELFLPNTPRYRPSLLDFRTIGAIARSGAGTFDRYPRPRQWQNFRTRSKFDWEVTVIWTIIGKTCPSVDSHEFYSSYHMLSWLVNCLHDKPVIGLIVVPKSLVNLRYQHIQIADNYILITHIVQSFMKLGWTIRVWERRE